LSDFAAAHYDKSISFRTRATTIESDALSREEERVLPYDVAAGARVCLGRDRGCARSLSHSEAFSRVSSSGRRCRAYTVSLTLVCLYCRRCSMKLIATVRVTDAKTALRSSALNSAANFGKPGSSTVLCAAASHTGTKLVQIQALSQSASA